VIEVHECFGWPEALPDVLARYQFAWTLKQHRQNFEGLPLELDSHSALPELARAQVGFEGPESNNPSPRGGFW
jgi:hypothetical protein